MNDLISNLLCFTFSAFDYNFRGRRVVDIFPNARRVMIATRRGNKNSYSFRDTVFPRIVAGSDYFYFRTKRGRLFQVRRLFEGGDQFRYFPQEVVPYIFCSIIPSNKEKAKYINITKEKKTAKKKQCFCNHSVLNN